MARALGLAPKTLARVEQRQGTSLPAVLDRLAALHHVVMVAEDVLGSRAAACEWLMRPHPLYKKTPPLLILDSYSGTVEVLRELERIAYGVMS